MIPIEEIQLLIKKLKKSIPKQSNSSTGIYYDTATYYDGRDYGERSAYSNSITELKKLIKKYETNSSRMVSRTD